jgi:hypothetical protein
MDHTVYRIFGLILRSLGYVIFFVGAGFVFSYRPTGFIGFITVIACGAAHAILDGTGRKFSLTARKIKAKDDLTSKDHAGPIVLYLRSFDDDAVAGQQISFRNPGGSWGAETTWTTSQTEEEQVATVLSEVGRFVALGRPGEELPELGADREYPTESDWREKIGAYMNEAVLVVIRLGQTRNLAWEISEAVRKVGPEKLVLLVPNRDRYETLRSQYQTLFPRSIPALQETRSIGDSSITAIISFDHDWNPTLVHLAETGKIIYALKPLTGAVKLALIPIFDRLGLPYKPL